jgi:mRNA interferase MazF
MTKPNRGDVVLVLFPNSDLRTAKRRPAVVLQSNAASTELPQTIVAMISSNMARVGKPSRVQIQISTPIGQRTGLKTDSVICIDNLVTVMLSEIDRAIGSIQDMTEIDLAIRHTLGV